MKGNPNLFLMMGGHLPETDPFTLQLLTNEEVIAVDQRSNALLNPNALFKKALTLEEYMAARPAP